MWKKKSLILIYVVFFCPKIPELYIADTFLGTAGVRYRQIWLHRLYWHSSKRNVCIYN